MIVTNISNGYVTFQLDQRDCQLLALVNQVARGHPDEIGDEAAISHVEDLSTLFTLAAGHVSAQVNMCPADHAAHVEHLNQTSLIQPQPVH